MNISRRRLLAALPFLPALGAATVSAAAAVPPARHYRLNRFSIAGFAYYAGPGPAGRAGRPPTAGTGPGPESVRRAGKPPRPPMPCASILAT